MPSIADHLVRTRDTVRQGWRFGSGLRQFLRDPIDAHTALTGYRTGIEQRVPRFLEALDRTVWSAVGSPYLPLLAHAGLDRDGLRDLVETHGLESALELLRDDGVYISYEEYLGHEPVRRGSLRMDVDPTSFHNRTITADFLGSTGGTRSGGTPVAVSFVDKRGASARGLVARVALDEPAGLPTAVWFPCLPSAAGLSMVLDGAGRGNPPQRWFSQIPTGMEGIPVAKRLTNTMLPFIGRISGVPLPHPEHVPSADPGPVLDWCIAALRAGGTAHLATYPSSAVRLARLAAERGATLDGLVVELLGEPATVARREVVARTGARTLARYAFMQTGGVGISCPDELADEYHLNDGKVAVVGRRRSRSDGVLVDALAWTTLEATARGVFINVENDDYGLISRDVGPCDCLFGQLGCRNRVAEIRGMSKVVAAGVTVRGEVLERLVDEVLPRSVGGTPLDFQFAEQDRDGQGVLVLRVDPGVGRLDDAEVVATVRAELRSEEMGRLADEVWAPTDSIRVERTTPVAARSGKTLPFEPLPTSPTGGSGPPGGTGKV